MKKLEKKEMSTVKGGMLEFARGLSYADNQQPSPVGSVVDDAGTVNAAGIDHIPDVIRV